MRIKKSHTLIIIAVATAILMLFTFNYWDGQTLMVWSVSNYDLLFEGRLNEFYTDKLLNVRGAIQTSGCSSPLMMIPQMIWDLPIWLTHYFNGNYYVGTLPCVFYYKLFLLLVTVCIALVVGRIIKEQTGDVNKSSLGIVLTMGSAQIMLSTMYTGQDEVVYLLFMLLSFWAAVKNQKKMMVLWGTLSVMCCPIMLVTYIVLVILSEKRFIRIISYIVISLLPNALWGLYSSGAADKEVVAIDDGDFIGKMLDMIVFPSTTGQVSLVGIIICIIVFTAYFKKDKEDGAPDFQTYIWYMSITIITITFLMDNFFYRLLLYVPFVLILILTNKRDENINLNIFLITLLEYLRMFTGGYESPQNLNTGYVALTGVMTKMLEATGSEAIEGYRYVVGKLVENFKVLGDLVPTFNAIALVCVALLLYINHEHNNRVYKLSISYKISTLLYVACMPLFMIVFYGILLR